MFESTADEICGFQKAENALKAYLPLKITDDKSHLFKILVNFSESFSVCLFWILYWKIEKKSQLQWPFFKWSIFEASKVEVVLVEIMHYNVRNNNSLIFYHFHKWFDWLHSLISFKMPWISLLKIDHNNKTLSFLKTCVASAAKSISVLDFWNSYKNGRVFSDFFFRRNRY